MASPAEEGQVIACHTVDEFENHLKKGNEQKKLVVVDFTAVWCPPCRVIAPVFAELAKLHPKAIFLKVDVDELKAVAEKWRVEAMPTFIFFKDGEIVDKLVGADKEKLAFLITSIQAGAVATA